MGDMDKTDSRLLIGEVPSMIADDVPVFLPNMPVATAAKHLIQNRIGMAVVVDEKQKVLGVLSKTDIVRITSERPSNITDLNIKHLYTKNPITCTVNDNAASILELMKSRDMRHIPLVEDKRLKGLVSFENLRSYLISDAGGTGDILKGQNVRELNNATPSDHNQAFDMSYEDLDCPDEVGGADSFLHDDDFDETIDYNSFKSEIIDYLPDSSHPKGKRPIIRFQVLVVGIVFIGILISSLTNIKISELDFGKLLFQDDKIGAGLQIRKVQSTRESTNDYEVLVVRGHVSNISDIDRHVPSIKAALIDGNDKELQFVITASVRDRISPGETVSFRAEIRDPSILARRLEVTFSKAPVSGAVGAEKPSREKS